MPKKVRSKTVRMPITLYDDILRFQRRMQSDENARFGKRKRVITFDLAAKTWHKQLKIRSKDTSFLGGSLL